MKTPYEIIGGESKIREILTSLYDKLFTDAIVGFLFEGKDKAHIVEQQVSLTCAFLGGPQRYEGKPLPQAHAALPLLPGHFDRRHHLLAQVLAERGVPSAAARAWLAIDTGLRTSVLTSGEDARARTRSAH